MQYNEIRETKSKRPDTDSIHKYLMSIGATNITITDVEEKIKFLVTKCKIENRPTRQGLDSFFIVKG